jgi:hypothetical protein
MSPRSLATAAGAVLSAALLLLLFGSPARAERESDEPQLELPGGCAVAPGQVVDLRWTDTDEVRELEILLSTDGGRTWSICISPELDPRTRHFLWRVPDAVRGPLSLRIRFNRGGREIEGPPLRLGPPDAGAQPLGLPPVDAVPRPARSGPTSSTSAGAPAETADGHRESGSPRRALSLLRAAARLSPLQGFSSPLFFAPRAVPLRV